MKIQKVTDPAFRRYGKVLEGYNFGPLLKEMKHTPVPEDVVYVPSAEELEALDVEKELKNRAQIKNGILQRMQENPAITQRKLMEEFELTRKQIQTIIKELQENGIVERQGPARSGKWAVKQI